MDTLNLGRSWTRRRCARRAPIVLLALLGLLVPSGCARSLTITQSEYINTAVHRNREPSKRTGERLEVAIVCVYPKDLENAANAALSPDTDITCDMWYQHRPVPGQVGGGRFDLPRERIYMLTDEKEVYGKPVGKSLRGAKQDGKEKMKIAGIDFHEPGWGKVGGSLFDERAVIYVFPRFVGPDGKVLRVAPAKFHPPGAYRSDLYVEIGVEDPGGAANQYIKNTTERKLNRGEKKK
jgi:hypothetical protein